MRGEQKSNIPPPRYHAATIIDSEGNTKYYAVPTRLAVLSVATILLIMLISCVLGLMVFFNKYDIDQIKKTINVEEKRDNECCSQNTN